MEQSTQQKNGESPSNDPNERVPKQVRLAAWLAVFGAIVVGGVASATPIDCIAGPCIAIAVMMAVVCYAIVRFR
jgi:hypothetical protein